MHCEACGAPLRGATIETGVCSRCATEIHYAATVPLREPLPDNMWLEYTRLVQKSPWLRESWRDGLGLMTPDEREHRLKHRTFERYKQQRRDGKDPKEALTVACGRSRGNLMFTYGAAETPMEQEAISYNHLW